MSAVCPTPDNCFHNFSPLWCNCLEEKITFDTTQFLMLLWKIQYDCIITQSFFSLNNHIRCTIAHPNWLTVFFTRAKEDHSLGCLCGFRVCLYTVLVISVPYAIFTKLHYSDFTQASSCLKLLATRLFVLTTTGTGYEQRHRSSILLTLFLTHWGRDKMAAVSQRTLSSAFSWMKMLEFWLRFHWSLFLRVKLTIIQHWFR